MKQFIKKTVAALLCTVMVGTVMPLPVHAAANKIYSIAELEQTIKGIINWKKLDNGSTLEGPLINDAYLELAGTTPGDWYQVGMGRFGYSDDYAGYLAVIREKVQDRYKTSVKLSAAKATEWQRISLAILASGGDPTKAGVDANGNNINLIADGTYNRGKTTSLGKQGINGWIWGLIALDSKRYPVPEGAHDSRDSIIEEIIRQQLTDGGFALYGNVSDPDITAMAVQSLAPYYNSEKEYTYKNKTTGKTVTKKIRQVIDESVNCLSKMQLNSGDYNSWGTKNVESTAQVAVALCSLGIDIQTDGRFIKNGNSLLNGIMLYRMEDGGFVHSYTYDQDNPTSLPTESNTMASEQTLYTLTAIWRQAKGMRTLYDFRPEQSPGLKNQINALKKEINNLGNTPTTAKIAELMKKYEAIPESEQCYVFNYYKLSKAAENGGIEIKEESVETAAKEEAEKEEEEEESVLLYFTDTDKRKVKALPKDLTTEQYVDVIKLIDKLEKSEDFDKKKEYMDQLLNAKKEILDIQKEIDNINKDVKEKLYPFEKISLSDWSVVHSIVNRYKKLSPYDQKKILRWDDVVKTETQVDNLVRAVVITIVLGLLSIVAAVFVIKHIKKRKNRKLNEMLALEKEYEEKEKKEGKGA
ncbi:prenyltransferase/squalene oxidase repeat-containing protein [Anaerovorax sp. IOR16]|uniref:prenyltransferase/squalene oxidase repeat-containing protein n=1 Tax=Anaerovorax sp. IOR16 TaxID=2773458 RepID=UPI0019CF681B|nr:terpene cyclase/mutase family protein [Anaerovorax sp. IOR16]